MSQPLDELDRRDTKDPAKRWTGRERPGTVSPSPRAGAQMRPGWDGPTYYGRPQLKSAPFKNAIVGGYIFLAGLSGAASLLGALADAVGGRVAGPLGRRARRLALLAPTLGAGLLITDLHTPQRFYNMLRLFKPRSPMSIGTWILMGFGASAVPAAICDALADRVPGLSFLRPVAKAAQAPAAIAGAGLSVYTASLLSATSTPVWAAAPQALAVRFAASSVASGGAALMLGERDPEVRQALQLVAVGALGAEVVAAGVQSMAYEEKGVEQATKGRWGRAERLLATGLGVVVPLALFGLSLALRRRRDGDDGLATAGALATLAGSAMLRISTLGMGDDSAVRPEISLRFAQPRNLPEAPTTPRARD